MMEETVYFGQLRSRSGAIHHTGDEREGDEDLGQGDDEIITIDLARLPPTTLALFFLANVATEGRSFADVKAARIRLVEWSSVSSAVLVRWHSQSFGSASAAACAA